MEKKRKKRNINNSFHLLCVCFPILEWLPKYSLEYLQCDIIAGVTVGMMVLPQALAYASIARLPTTYGLYASFLGGFVYCIFGTSKDITIGPTAILSLMVQTYNIPHCVDLAILLSFYTGFILIMMGIFRLGFLVRFFSIPVISAFTSAAALTIACGQLKDILGIEHLHRDFFGNLEDVFKEASMWNYYDLVYGLISIIILLLMRLLTKLKWNNSFSVTKIICYKFLWICGIGRNALLVLVSCAIVYTLDQVKKRPFTVISDVKGGLPGVTMPKFSRVTCGNETLGFEGTLQYLNTGLVIVPLLAFIETMAIGRAFSRVNHYKIRPTQELFAIGIANLLNSFVFGYPVTGSFSRTAVNSQSGVKTPLGGIFTGLVVILAIQFLCEMFQYIPKACLGAIIISALILVVDVSVIKSMWKIRRIELIPYIFTFGGCLYSLDVGLLVGVVTSLSILLYSSFNPSLEVSPQGLTVVNIHENISYLGVTYFTSRVESIIEQEEPPPTIVFDFQCVTHIDYTVLVELHQLVKELDCHRPMIETFFTNVSFPMRKLLFISGLHHKIASAEYASERLSESERLLSQEQNH